MTLLDAADVPRVAAEAALAVPGVSGLHPSLRWSLAGAAQRVRSPGPVSPSPESGVRARRDGRTGAWLLEVRCVVDDGRRPLDTARDVREGVRSAVSAHLGDRSSPGPGPVPGPVQAPGPGSASGPEPVNVVVYVTRITVRHR
ncbi:hypothetical protein [Streptomyces sp. NBC_01497]|uniref:hypothetical protein n=1 Tax=Streptomyces sp. NBC_01497 TaxID=2903885 RepID=UPI002E33F0A9|nr:hypothetical protein [Streptomyces sp. NBC_01497]